MEASQPVENVMVCVCGITCSHYSHPFGDFSFDSRSNGRGGNARRFGNDARCHSLSPGANVSSNYMIAGYSERAEDEPQELVTGAFTLVVLPGKGRGLVVS